MIIVYTGNGKGKTTAALGLALRSLGHKNKVTCIHFMKNFASGESKFENEFYESYQFGSGNFVVENPVIEDLEFANKGFALAKTKITDCDVLILDEMNMALYFKLLEITEVMDFLKSVPENKTVIVTGRKAMKELIEIADTVTEMKEIKHAYQKGIKAQKGIEY